MKEEKREEDGREEGGKEKGGEGRHRLGKMMRRVGWFSELASGWRERMDGGWWGKLDPWISSVYDAERARGGDGGGVPIKF